MVKSPPYPNAGFLCRGISFHSSYEDPKAVLASTADAQAQALLWLESHGYLQNRKKNNIKKQVFKAVNSIKVGLVKKQHPLLMYNIFFLALTVKVILLNNTLKRFKK